MTKQIVINPFIWPQHAVYTLFLASQLERKFELEALQKENNANRIHELGKLQKEQSRQGQQLLSLDQGLSGKIQGKQLTMSWN